MVFVLGRALMDNLISPLELKIEEWKKVASLLDKDHAKGTVQWTPCVRSSWAVDVHGLARKHTFLSCGIIIAVPYAEFLINNKNTASSRLFIGGKLKVSKDNSP